MTTRFVGNRTLSAAEVMCFLFCERREWVSLLHQDGIVLKITRLVRRVHLRDQPPEASDPKLRNGCAAYNHISKNMAVYSLHR